MSMPDKIYVTKTLETVLDPKVFGDIGEEVTEYTRNLLAQPRNEEEAVRKAMLKAEKILLKIRIRGYDVFNNLDEVIAALAALQSAQKEGG